MIRRLFLTALTSGILAGLIISAVHQLTTVPIILEAESYEAAHKAHHIPGPIAPHAHPHPPHAQATVWLIHGTAEGEPGARAWAPRDGVERVLFTVMTTVLLGTGFALLLSVGMILKDPAPDGRRGLLWGAGGFAAFTLAPALGLPPELPGMATADLVARQTWWLTAALSTAAGIWIAVFTRHALWKLAAIALIAGPHLIGAPTPPAFSQAGPPPELAAEFAATSIAISALFWAMLGGFSGYFLKRFS